MFLALDEEASLGPGVDVSLALEAEVSLDSADTVEAPPALGQEVSLALKVVTSLGRTGGPGGEVRREEDWLTWRLGGWGPGSWSRISPCSRWVRDRWDVRGMTR